MWPSDFDDVGGVRFLEKAEPAERNAPRGRPGVDPAQAIVRAHLINAFLVLVPLFFRDQQLGQGPVDAFHQGIGGQPGAEDQLAGAVQQPVGLRGGRGRRTSAASCAAPARRVPAVAGAATTRTRSVRPVGNGSPSGPGDAAQGRQELGVLHGRAGRLAGAGGPQGFLLLLGERLEGLVDPERGRERQPGLSVVDVPRHWITTLPWPAAISPPVPQSPGHGPRRPCPCAPRGRSSHR